MDWNDRLYGFGGCYCVMTEKELKSLSRADLLELLIQQGKVLETERAAAAEKQAALQAEIDSLTARLNDRVIRAEEAGSVAEASLRLSGVFEVAQKAADTYLESIRVRDAESAAACAYRTEVTDTACAKKTADTDRSCALKLQETEAACAARIAETERICTEKLSECEKLCAEKRFFTDKPEDGSSAGPTETQQACADEVPAEPVPDFTSEPAVRQETEMPVAAETAPAAIPAAESPDEEAPASAAESETRGLRALFKRRNK